VLWVSPNTESVDLETTDKSSFRFTKVAYIRGKLHFEFDEDRSKIIVFVISLDGQQTPDVADFIVPSGMLCTALDRQYNHVSTPVYRKAQEDNTKYS